MNKTKFLKLLAKKYPSWKDLRNKLRKKEISIKEALDEILKRKTVNLVKKNESKEFIQIADFKIKIERVDKVYSCPKPSYFRPILKLNRKNRTGILIIFEGTYKNYNSLECMILDKKEINSNFYILIGYTLYRKNLRFGRYKEFNYLVGYDDNSIFVERVSPKLSRIDETLNWLKPFEVIKAEKEKRKVLRQGDVFFVELKTKRKKISDYRLPFNHRLLNDKIVIHHEHSTLILPHPYFKPVLRKSLDARTD